MKILLVHNAYQLAGGEDTVVAQELALMRRYGDEVTLHTASNDAVQGLIGKLKAACGVVFSASTYRALRRRLREERPDVVHVHNFFPLLSPSVFYACRAERVPVVMTLHNYRIVCPTALLMHDGQVTERSLTQGPWWGVRARVYRGSWAGSFMLALMIAVHQRIGTWHRCVDRFIVLSPFGFQKFAQAGLPAAKLVIKPHFVDVAAPAPTARDGLLFVGRLSQEKGVCVMLKAIALLKTRAVARKGLLRIAGAGPLEREVRQSGAAFLGALSASEVRAQMGSAAALVLPSTCYEGFPMVLVEAYASGLPVIASRIGALAELVEDGVTGLLCAPGDADDLAQKMAWALTHRAQMAAMGIAARERYEASYTPERNYEQLMAVYRSVTGPLEPSDPTNRVLST